MMATQERRRKLTIEQINEYWRRIKQGEERPNLHKLCNAIRVLDVALADSASSLCKGLSVTFWSKIRDDLFDVLVSSFSGYFLVYPDGSTHSIEPGDDWPASATVEFYPEQANRRDDACSGALGKMHPNIVLRLRWAFAEGKQTMQPSDFESYRECMQAFDTAEEAQEAHNTMTRVYETCAHEAGKLKKIAHRKWWQLHYQASGCADRRQKLQLRKQMEQLELVWGRSTS